MAVKKAGGTPATKTFKFNVPGAKDKVSGIKDYAGPKPPSGAYKVVLKRLTVEENAGGPCLKILMEIQDTGPRAKYNGFGIWSQQNMTDKGAGYVNQFLEAIGGTQVKDDFWELGARTKPDEKKIYHVKKIGEFTVNSPSIKGIELVVTTSAGRYKGKDKLDVRSYLSLSESNLDADDVEEFEEEFEEEDLVDDEDADEDADEDEDEDDDSEDEDDEEDEGELFDDEDDDDED